MTIPARKRHRSGSVSGRLQSASDYLDSKGLLDRHTRGILKDLIIIGDEVLQDALDQYENHGDARALEGMIESGALADRLPQDLDLLGDLDLDFLTVDESTFLVGNPQQSMGGVTVSPEDEGQSDDGDLDEAMVGDLEFNAYDEGDEHQQHHHEDPPLSHSPQEGISEYERRLRSNSLYSALLNRRESTDETMEGPQVTEYGRWMEPEIVGSARPTTSVSNEKKKKKHPPPTNDAPVIQVRKKKTGRRPKGESNLTASLKKAEARRKKKQQQRLNGDSSLPADDEDDRPPHISGSGRPRSLSDPLLQSSIDPRDGTICITRPDGWVGAYSPDSRKLRIERFLEKRQHRVWTKSVKYNVRKDFADSRLRVRGRFVKKEDETLMRELMSLT